MMFSGYRAATHSRRDAPPTMIRTSSTAEGPSRENQPSAYPEPEWGNEALDLARSTGFPLK
jgi:hypothetical protein